MKHVFILILPLLTACGFFGLGGREYVPNPDPNHTHADIAVWIDGERVDFSGDEHMSTEEHHLHDYLHLHDNIGHVLHQHKLGLKIADFFDSLGFTFRSDREWRMFVNGVEQGFDLAYVCKDMDQILITTSSNNAHALDQLKEMTSDGCLYSKTCPWRGDPPAENCIADPAVPCVAPLF
jgi:hypothetical protein